MWGGRFSAEPDAVMADINASIEVDCKLFRQDIAASRAHAQMLGHQGIISAPDAEATSVGQQNFEWVVNAVAEMAVKKALSDENPARELRWAAFLTGEGTVAVAAAKP